MPISLAQYEQALNSLNKAIAQPKDEFIRDAVIQRFEFTFELAWKTAKKCMGSNSSGTRTIIREMAQDGIIEDVELWFALLEARNLSVHTYKEALAEKVYEIAVSASSEFARHLQVLKKL